MRASPTITCLTSLSLTRLLQAIINVVEFLKTQELPLCLRRGRKYVQRKCKAINSNQCCKRLCYCEISKLKLTFWKLFKMG